MSAQFCHNHGVAFLLIVVVSITTAASASLDGKKLQTVKARRKRTLITEHDSLQYVRELCQWSEVLDGGWKRAKHRKRDDTTSSPQPQHGEACSPCQWIGRTLTGQCEEQCSCTIQGTWRCCRMRKEFSLMSDAEARRYINTYLTLTTVSPHKEAYDAMVAKHERLFSHAIHHWPQFWPWHRYFTLKFENMLKRIDCRVTLPYWDFTRHWRKPWDGPMWSDSRLGGSGLKAANFCVTTGPFAMGKWNVTPSAGGGCLKREFDQYRYGISPRVLTLGQYAYEKPSQVRWYEKIISVYMHSWVHVTLGGIMATHKSANEPAFWMLHSFADKLWGNWQQRGAHFLYEPYVRMRTRLSDQEDDDTFTVADMVDLSDLPSAGAPTGGPRTAICYDGEMSVETAYDQASLHALPVPRDYAHEYSPHRSLPRLLHSILRDTGERAQFEKMQKDPFQAGFEVF
ncbi:uncharacterized protein LOC135811511 [Sycon ciliatum]|uniref:uncharacterized protein LOC135811511 n=1 Tax=Sycon ciliatum TaxID=27933 RepID=UPI0020A96687|eukprot:scpid50969/ scgid18425/ Tyrosinase; Monophenol monooxygenase